VRGGTRKGRGGVAEMVLPNTTSGSGGEAEGEGGGALRHHVKETPCRLMKAGHVVKGASTLEPTVYAPPPSSSHFPYRKTRILHTLGRNKLQHVNTVYEHIVLLPGSPSLQVRWFRGVQRGSVVQGGGGTVRRERIGSRRVYKLQRTSL